MKTKIKTVVLTAILILFTIIAFGNNKNVITSESNISPTIVIESELELENWMTNYHVWNNPDDTLYYQRINGQKMMVQRTNDKTVYIYTTLNNQRMMNQKMRSRRIAHQKVMRQQIINQRVCVYDSLNYQKMFHKDAPVQYHRAVVSNLFMVAAHFKVKNSL